MDATPHMPPPPSWSRIEAVLPAGAGGAAPVEILPTSDGGRYGKVIARVRADVAAGLRRRPGYVVGVLDVTRPDAGAELRRIDRDLVGRVAELGSLRTELGAYSVLFPTRKGLACVAAGYPPGTDPGRLLTQVAALRSVDRTALDDGTFHLITLWHEVGHCLLGRSEAEADVFAFLVAIRLGVDVRALEAWAAWREVAEWSSPFPRDDHVASAALWAVLDRVEAVRAKDGFAKAGLERVAALAKAFVDAHGADADAKRRIFRVRDAVAAGAVALASTSGATATLAILDGWFAGKSPPAELGRLVRARGFLESGRGRPTSPTDAEDGSLERFLSAEAARGDVVARAMLDRLLDPEDEVAVPRREHVFAKGIPFDVRPDDADVEVAGGTPRRSLEASAR